MFAPSLFVLLLAAVVSADMTTGRPGHGLIGYGINMYNPICASACSRAIPLYLYCSDGDLSSGSSMAATADTATTNLTATQSPSVECLASNTPYLQTVAYCMYTHCDGSTTPAQRELWWYSNVVGTLKDQPPPSMTYQGSLASLASVPNQTITVDTPLISPGLLSDSDYIANANVMANFQWVEGLHSRYRWAQLPSSVALNGTNFNTPCTRSSIILVTTCAIVPMFLSLLRFLPLSPPLVSRLRASFIDTPLHATRITAPFLGRIEMATRGQVLFMAYIVAVNVILSSVGYKSVQPNAWWTTRGAEITTYIANRTGALSFANIPLLILYSGRNNILLWLTNWSHSTFLLLHRCVAVVAVLQACLHSAIYLQIRVAEGTLYSESKLPYWIWGIIGTLTMALLLPLSIRPLRAAAYELFLVTHIVLSVFVIVGCWYHMVYRFAHQWGYEVWMYVAIAIWGFDRFVRFVRIARNGVRKAFVYKIDDEYIRLDIPDMDCSGHVYAYFPQVTWNPRVVHRSWQSHPFSIASYNSTLPVLAAVLGREDVKEVDDVSGKESDDGLHDAEARYTPTDAFSHGGSPRPQSITILIRVRDGITRDLAKKAASFKSLTPPPSIPILVESSYGGRGHDDILADASNYPNVLCFAGGVGVTALLSLLSNAAYSPMRRGSVKLYWSSRSARLVRAVESLVADHSKAYEAKSPWGAIEAHVSVGERLQLEGIMDGELGSVGTVVVVCGPAGMAEEVRALVARKGRGGAVVRLVEESFDW